MTTHADFERTIARAKIRARIRRDFLPACGMLFIAVWAFLLGRCTA